MSIRPRTKQGHRRARLLAVVAVGGLVATSCGSDSQTVARADSNREIIVNMDEFSYGVDVIELTAGETVTFVLVNQGDNEHEFMIGRNVQDTSEGYPNGFEHDFFETVTPMVDPPEAGMNMGGDMAGMDMSGGGDMGSDGHSDEGAADGSGDMAGMDMPADDHADDASGDMAADASGDMAADGSGDMAGMDMPADDHADDASGDMAADGSGDMAGMDMPADDHAADTGGDGHSGDGEPGMDMGGDDHSGFMVQRGAGEVARITVTVPDDVVGDWEIGCFRGRGSHWDAGMRARLVVLEA